MKEIRLSDHQKLITYDTTLAYKVKSGTALLYLLPHPSDGYLRWMFLGTASTNHSIPAVNTQKDWLGQPCQWLLLIIPQDTLVVEEIEADEMISRTFLKEMQLIQSDEQNICESLEDILFSSYQIYYNNELKSINERICSRSKTQEHIHTLLASVLHKTGIQHAKKSYTGNSLYDAMSFLCSYNRISISPHENIIAACGSHYTINDIARLSGFVCRKIKLDSNFMHSETVPVLCYFQDKEYPVVCFRSYKKTLLYLDPVTDCIQKMTLQDSYMLEPFAYTIHTPLNGANISMKEITKYIFRSLSFRDIFTMLIGMLLATLVNIGFTKLHEILYDIIIPQGDHEAMIGLGFLLIACILGASCFSITQYFATFRLNNRCKYTLQAAIYDRLFHMPESFFHKYKCADLAYRTSTLADSYIGLFHNTLQLLLTICFSTVYFIQMHSYSSFLCVLGMFFVMIQLFLTLVTGYITRKYQQKKIILTGNLRSFLFQVFSGIITLRTHGVEDDSLEEYMNKYTQLTHTELKHSYIQLISSATMILLNGCTICAFYYTITHNNLFLSIGGFLAFTSIFTTFSMSMNQVATNALSIFSMLPMLKHSMDLLTFPPERANQGIIPTSLKGNITITNINFGYNYNEDYILKNINLQIHAGEYIGIVGTSGCGKSTLLRLILGFEKPNIGKIYYDGIDLDKLNKPELRRKMGIVLQDNSVFSGTILQNLQIACPHATEDEIWKALEMAELKNDIARMPLGLHTIISEQAQTISIGQKQRIMIARAILNNPQIYLFDEATSALDNITQERICSNLSKIHATRITIAHRLSTVIHCDRIIVMEQGKIVEVGNYQQLMDNKSYFYRLVQHQTL